MAFSEDDVRAFLALGVDQAKMVHRFQEMEPQDIATVLPHLRSTGFTGATFDAIRDAGQAIMQQKANDRLIATLEKLDRSAGRLAVVGIVLSAIIGIAGIVVPLFLHKP